MNHFIVMQGHTYQEEKGLEIIWSPKKDRGGNVPMPINLRVSTT
ncbi:hypothetical protein P4I03_31880 [Bacillus cereus]|nr:hypothetical protein [Bacillus thuringiensis]MEB8597662.1 hypothetical protein [Bacillus cereus]MEB8616255.1 hypothetical protein [Bacillus cereus]MEB8622166.1 hypothetical protein [Bacillus cereus]MEB8836325.1 hypothetical protein [Bacillus cereus]MEB9280540.1 hypothetical protein [Bacillus cereus]